MKTNRSQQEMLISSTVTEGIRIVVRSSYLAEQSTPAAGRYAFSYEVRIWNEGRQAAQLRARHWTITDSSGKVQEVCGAGVVGEEPLLRPGAHFQYTSRATLETPRGEMRGSYLMQRPNGRVFDALIAPFALAQPHSLN
jgi:ApaG protein